MKLLSRLKSTIVRRSDDILMGLGISGIFVTAFFAGKNTLDAKKKIEEEKKKEKVDRLDRKKVVKTVWKCYIPTAISAITSTGCLLGSRHIKSKRYSALLAAYSITEKALVEYKDAAVDVLGEKKEKQITDAMAKKAIEKDPNINKQVIITGKGDSKCYDSAFGRYFYSNYEKIRQSVNNLNARLMSEMYITLNEFYIELGLPVVEIGDELGWKLDNGLIDLTYSSQLDEDGVPCLVISYRVKPKEL